MKKVLTLIFGLIISLMSFSQSCLPEGIGFGTQAQIDSFAINYPNCDRIEGDVIIGEGSGINNLDGLNVLTSIGGGLWIHYNPDLVSISGLQNITSIGGLFFLDENDGLTSLEGLENVDTIGGGMVLQFNGSLTTIEALSGVTYIGGDISLADNPSLVNLNGLENLSMIEGSLNIVYNASLSSLSALAGITSIGEFLLIRQNNSLVSLAGLGNLTSVGKDFRLGDGWGGNHSLVNLADLANLQSIGGNLWIIDNVSLTDLSGLDNLMSIGGYINISLNTDLTSLNGIDNISAGSITDIKIYSNPALTTCAIQSVCDYLASPNGTIEIHDNATGCNSQEEVEAACGVGVDESAVDSWQSAVNIYPNPSSTQITIELLSTSTLYKNTTLTIFNLNGQQIIKRQVTEPLTVVDVSGLHSGVYFLKVITDDRVMVSKFVKQ